jgi:hypothetical protein
MWLDGDDESSWEQPCSSGKEKGSGNGMKWWWQEDVKADGCLGGSRIKGIQRGNGKPEIRFTHCVPLHEWCSVGMKWKGERKWGEARLCLVYISYSCPNDPWCNTVFCSIWVLLGFLNSLWSLVNSPKEVFLKGNVIDEWETRHNVMKAGRTGFQIKREMRFHVLI